MKFIWRCRWPIFSLPLVLPGNVYPAAGFVHEAKLHGAHTVELNLERSQVGNEFAEKYYGPASQVVPEFVEKLLKGL
ncbi:hypothetical protein ACLB1R_12730 [Escherichia coli]